MKKAFWPTVMIMLLICMVFVIDLIILKITQCEVLEMIVGNTLGIALLNLWLHLYNEQEKT